MLIDGRGGNPDYEAYAAFGLPLPPEATDEIELPPAQYRAVAIFRRCMTQWRWLAGFGKSIRTGLDYTAVKAIIEMMGEKIDTQLLDDIAELEQEALVRLNGK
jgi:hypothetical protein